MCAVLDTCECVKFVTFLFGMFIFCFFVLFFNMTVSVCAHVCFENSVSLVFKRRC